MHKLDRSAVPVPACLANPDERGYGDLHGAEKAEIRSALLTMQHEKCAYCERRTCTRPNDGHIEHFRNQADHKGLTRDWNNLFWSCNDEATCGKHKDKCDKHSGIQAKFEREVLIDPCADDPDHFLIFLTDGTVHARDGLNVEDRRRAEETLRVFQLSASPQLRKAREDALEPYHGIIETLRSADPNVFFAYIESELKKIHSRPFAAAIKHFLESVLSA